MRDAKLYTILNDIGIKTASFTAATTDVITSSAHGLVNGNKIILTTSDTLPAGLALATVYYVVEAAANTFKVSLIAGTDGTPADITSTGTGTHTFTMHDIGNDIFVEDYKHCVFTYDTDGGGDAALTVKFQGSVAEAAPDFSAAQSATNQWDYIEVIDLEDGTAIDGDTGVAVATADDHRQLEANINGMRWVNAIISGWTAGEITIKVRVFNNA
jgi:hypothetical protein